MIFLLISPDDGESHLKMIGRMGIILNDSAFRAKLRQCSDGYDLIEMLQKKEKEIIKN